MTDQQTEKTTRPARVAAIDPGSVKAGLVVLHIQPPPAGFIVPEPGAVAVLASHTVRSRKEHREKFALRMLDIMDGIYQWATVAQKRWEPGLWCLEDPRGSRQRGHSTAVTLGAAFGVACAALSMVAMHSEAAAILVPAQVWIPKTRTGNFIHPMKHKAARDWLRGRWPALQDLTDDETFAAGVALWAHTKGAMAALYPI